MLNKQEVITVNTTVFAMSLTCDRRKIIQTRKKTHGLSQIGKMSQIETNCELPRGGSLFPNLTAAAADSGPAAGLTSSDE